MRYPGRLFGGITRMILPVVAGAATCAAPAQSAKAGGIESIRAMPDRLEVRLAARPTQALRLVEFRSHEPDAPPAGRPAVWQGRVPGRIVSIPRFDGARDRLYSRFQLADAASGRPVGPPRWVDDLSVLSRPIFRMPWPRSIKGLFIQDLDDAVALGAKHTVYNILVSQVVDWSGRSTEKWDVDGEKIPINTAFIGRLDAAFKRMTDAGISITLIVLNGVPDRPAPHNPFIHPGTDLAGAPNHLGAFNTRDEKGLRYYRAVLEYLARRYSDPAGRHGWVSGYIIGNEVQSHWEWHNTGHIPPEALARDYALSLRIADLAVRRFHPDLRVYVSLDHHWTASYRPDPTMTMPGRDLLEMLNARIRREGDFPWQLVFHPYPEDLFEPRAWRDRQAVPSFDTPKITFKNLEVLPAYLAQRRFLYQGRRRGILLSEQGMHTPDTPDGETRQAAGFAYAWYRVRRIPGIRAFVYFRHVDTRDNAGLKFGLWTWKDDDPRRDILGKKRPIYDLFRAADTPGWEEAFAFAKPLIGIRDWKEIAPVRHIEETPDPTPSLVLVEPGAPPRSSYRIVVPDRSTPATRYAAGELQRFVRRIAGATLPIMLENQAGNGPAILLGPGRRARRIVPPKLLASLGPDGVLLRTAGPNVALLGQGERGQLYSVYVLLERYLGVRFLARDGTMVPKRERLTLPAIDYRYTPPFMYRETLYADSYPKEIAGRQRLNGPNSLCDASTGGKIIIFPYVHSFSKLVPPEKYFQEHPEYFSLVGGKRTSATVHGQLCLTNPDVLQIATAQVLRWIEERPEVPIFDVSQNDGEGACECARCAAVVKEEGSQHGPILRFVNAIADVVAKKHPDRWIETLAYAYSTKPPALTKPRPNVIIRLCHAGCYFHGFEACGLGANLAGNLAAWSQVTRRIFLWHYATNFAHYIAPNQNLEGLVRDIRYYASHNVNGLMVQANYQGSGGDLAELRQYLAAQLMWDPDRDPGMVRVEFCRGYYGAAAPDVLEYLALLDEAAKRPDVHTFGAWDPRATAPPEMVREGLAILRRAQARADMPETAARVARLLLPLRYMQLSWPETYGLTPADAPRALLEFRSVVAAANVTYVREDFSQPSMPGWLAEMEKRYGPMTRALAADLYAMMGTARRKGGLDWRPSTVREGERERPSIFHHPAASGDADATYTLALPALQPGERLLLRFGTAITGPTQDGIRFTVMVDGAPAWSAEQATGPTQEREIDLSPWAGKRVRLTLRVNARENLAGDWANWVEPAVLVDGTR